MPIPPFPPMVLRKRVPAIVPLHEVANSAATPEQPTTTDPPAQSQPPLAINPFNTEDGYPPPAEPHPMLNANPPAPNSNLVPGRRPNFNRHLPARKNKRLRPSLQTAPEQPQARANALTPSQPTAQRMPSTHDRPLHPALPTVTPPPPPPLPPSLSAPPTQPPTQPTRIANPSVCLSKATKSTSFLRSATPILPKPATLRSDATGRPDAQSAQPPFAVAPHALSALSQLKSPITKAKPAKQKPGVVRLQKSVTKPVKPATVTNSIAYNNPVVVSDAVALKPSTASSAVKPNSVTSGPNMILRAPTNLSPSERRPTPAQSSLPMEKSSVPQTSVTNYVKNANIRTPAKSSPTTRAEASAKGVAASQGSVHKFSPGIHASPTVKPGLSGKTTPTSTGKSPSTHRLAGSTNIAGAAKSPITRTTASSDAAAVGKAAATVRAAAALRAFVSLKNSSTGKLTPAKSATVGGLKTRAVSKKGESPSVTHRASEDKPVNNKNSQKYQQEAPSIGATTTRAVSKKAESKALISGTPVGNTVNESSDEKSPNDGKTSSKEKLGVKDKGVSKERTAREKTQTREKTMTKAKNAMKETPLPKGASPNQVATSASNPKVSSSKLSSLNISLRDRVPPVVTATSKATGTGAASSDKKPQTSFSKPAGMAAAAGTGIAASSDKKPHSGRPSLSRTASTSRGQTGSSRLSSQANGASSRRSREESVTKKGQTSTGQTVPLTSAKVAKSAGQVSSSSKAQSLSDVIKPTLRAAYAGESASGHASSAGESISRIDAPAGKKKRRADDEESLNRSNSPAPDDISMHALLRIALVAKQKNILWTKIKGHPYWPTQLVELNSRLEEDSRFQQALRFRRKGETTCVMYFGTCEVAYVNLQKACMSWADGVSKGLHTAPKSRTFFNRALVEVKSFCSRVPRFPRGWWCEPQVIILADDLTEIVQHQLQAMGPYFVRAEAELIYWAKIRGFPQWPVQVLPRNMAAESYPELKLSGIGEASNLLPCMFFGTAEVALVLERNLTPFGAGASRGYVLDSDRQDFHIAIGEVWGYLQNPRVWPAGYLSCKTWWNYSESQADGSRLEDCGRVYVPHMPAYEHIRKSVWVDGVDPLPKPKASDIACCGCKLFRGEDRCVDATCLNFASHFLCDASCLGSYCKNVVFHKRRSPRMTPFFTPDQRGWGLKVSETVKGGSFVIEYIGEIINREVLEKRLKTMEKDKSNEYYMMDLTNDLLVDAKFKSNLSRFINSSCEPNCETQKWTDPSTGQTHVGIFAIQDIPAGTELTYNYCFLDFGLSGKSRKRSFSCQCGTASCCMLDPIEQKLMRELIGRRLEVRWDDGWYLGVVESYSLKKKRFRVQYDDGDCEDLVLGLPLAEKDDEVAFRLVDDKGGDDKSDSRDSKNSKTKKG